jgi:lactaldehyde dehydrogenase / glycolaldehyde dehydrogenase
MTLARRLKLGDPLAAGTDLGPKVTKAELEKVEQMVDRAREQGAEVLTGGQRAEVPGFDGGYWYEPTIITTTSSNIEIMQEEIFGPVSPVIAFDSFEEALGLANNSQYGLSAYLFSNDAKTVRRFIEPATSASSTSTRSGLSSSTATTPATDRAASSATTAPTA